MDELTISFIQILHLVFILFVLITPFTNNAQLLLLHAVTIPFLYIHWILNDDTCMLTVLERYYRLKAYGKIDNNECFTHRLISPIYKFNGNHAKWSRFIYIITFVLWLISVYKLYRKVQTGEFDSWKELLCNAGTNQKNIESKGLNGKRIVKKK